MPVALSSDEFQSSPGLRSILSPWKIWVVPICLTVFLMFVSRYNFLLFHILAEFFAIMVAVILSVVAWNTYRFSRNNYLMYLGTGYFWIGAVDLMHALSFKGMNIFEFANSSPNTSIQFWLVARTMEAILLTSAPFFLLHNFKRLPALLLFATGTFLAFQVIAEGYFPVTYINGTGLTSFKVYSEYAIIILLGISIGYLAYHRNLIDARIFNLIVIATLLTITAELCFTLYINVDGTFMFLGHIFKMFSFWFIFIAVIRTTLTEPYQIMARGFSTYDAIPDPTIVVDMEGTVLQVNQAACDSIKLQRKNILNQNCHELFHPKQYKNDNCDICSYIRQGRALPGHELYFEESKTWRSYTLSKLETVDGVKAMVHVSPDITRRKRIEEQLSFQANYDPLTGFPNRILATDRLKMAVRQSNRHAKNTGVMFIDVDNFKHINDTLGHGMGDRLLTNVGERIAASVRESDTVARWGGDEFLIVLPGLDSMLAIESIANNILDAMSRPINIEDKSFTISVSIGISSYPDSGETPEELLSNADVAMYEAKNAGKNTHCFYLHEMSDTASKRLEIESLLRFSIENNELYVVYQPQIDISTSQVVGCEALLRWQSEQLGSVPPDVFIPIAEESGLINKLGDWVLETVCKDYQKIRNTNPGEIRVSINISSRQLRDIRFASKFVFLLEKYKINADCILVEITESALLGDDDTTEKVLNILREAGLHLSLDDFGKGYSSLSYLKKLPFNEIKIDRSFVRDCVSEPSDGALCKAIIAMAESLDLRIVGEGVETKEQLEFLERYGVSIVQGYYFSKPMVLNDFLEYSNTFNTKSRS